MSCLATKDRPEALTKGELMEEFGADWLGEVRATPMRLNRGKAQRLLVMLLTLKKSFSFDPGRNRSINPGEVDLSKNFTRER
jgi:hypothetical protein